MEALLTSTAVAQLLGVHPETIKVYARTGALDGVKLGNRWRFRPSAIERFLARKVDDHKNKQYDDEVVQFQPPRGRTQ